MLPIRHQMAVGHNEAGSHTADANAPVQRQFGMDAAFQIGGSDGHRRLS